MHEATGLGREGARVLGYGIEENVVCSLGEKKKKE